ncbi:MAG: hypothetical protein ACPG7F_11085 [Aggregatilineales bacterium]
MDKIIEFKTEAPPCKVPLCNLTWLQSQHYVLSGRGMVRLETLMKRLTIHELRSLRERALSNALYASGKTFKRWLKIADMALQAIHTLSATLRSVVSLIAPGYVFTLPRTA